MKKFFFFAAALVASMSMMAQQPAVEFHYMPTLGDKNANQEEYTTDKNTTCTVAADEVLISGTNFTVKNAYATKYVAVGVMADTAYNTIMIGNEAVNFVTRRIQGQDNPKDAAAGNPATSLNVPTSGACFKVDVQKAGLLIVAVKSTPDKNQFAYSGLVGAGAALKAQPNEYRYLTMSNNTSGTAIGNPDGCLQIYVKGDRYGILKSSPETPGSLYGNGTYKTNGAGVMVVEVTPEQSPYIIGTGGSKMMACGFAFVDEDDANFENLTIVAKGCTDKAGNPHSDVTLYDANLLTNPNLKVQDCSKVLKEIKLTAYMPDAWVNDTIGYAAHDLKKKFGCYVWADGITGVIHEMAVDKDNDHKYTYTAKVDESVASINAIFINSHLIQSPTDSTKMIVSIDWNGDANQTVNIENITESSCYIVAAAASAKATVADDTDCDGKVDTALEDVMIEAMDNKFIKNGHLYLKKNGRVYNAAGAMVK